MTLKDAADKVRNAGIEVLGFDDRSYPDWQEFFLHPKEGQGKKKKKWRECCLSLCVCK